MLRTFAYEISKVAHELGALDTVSVKLADADSVQDMQEAVATGSDTVYAVMEKKASEVASVDLPEHRRMTVLVEKVAECLGKPAVPADMLHKIAAVVEADHALTHTLETVEMPQEDAVKLATLRVYGREYFMELLRGVV